MKKLLFLPFILFLFVFAGAIEKEPIAVLDLKAKGVDPATASILSDELRTVLFKAGNYNVLNREDMKAILGEHAFQQSGACDDTKCMAKVGGALGVVFMVTGSIGKLGDTYSITLKMIDIEKIENVNIVDEKYRGAEDGLFNAIQAAGNRLVGKEAAAASPTPVPSAPSLVKTAPAPAAPRSDRLEITRGFWNWYVYRDGIKIGPPFGAFGSVNGNVKSILNNEPAARPLVKKAESIGCSYILVELVALGALLAAPSLVENGNTEAGIAALVGGGVVSLVNMTRLKTRTNVFTKAVDLYNGGGRMDRTKVTYSDIKAIRKKVTVIGTKRQMRCTLFVYGDRLICRAGERARMLHFRDIRRRRRDGAVTYYTFGDEEIGLKGLGGTRVLIDRLLKKYKTAKR